MSSAYLITIGLEVHVQLLTKTKMFSGMLNQYGDRANANACAIDLGLPGVLPAINQEAVNMAIKFGCAVDADIASSCFFARKHYHYPDLPKGYQTTQSEEPILTGGYLTINADGKRVELTRAHLEEDAGKSVHHGDLNMSWIDLNRAGVPLLEIVSEPCITCPEDAVTYLKKLHTLVRYLEICDGNMQEGSFRCDVNISLRRHESDPLGTKVEIKNMNSFRFIEKALHYEIERQSALLDAGELVVQETRLYNSAENLTLSMRQKEDAHDYRYFPDPDLYPVSISMKTIEAIREKLPELPQQKIERLMSQYQIPEKDAVTLSDDPVLAQYFEEVVNLGAPAELSANWILSELLAMVNEHQVTLAEIPLSSSDFSKLLQRIADGTISGKIAKTLLPKLWAQPGDPDELIKAEGLQQISGTEELTQVIEKIFADYPQQLQQYRQGQEKLFGFFVGQVMKATRGQANPQVVNELLTSLLSA